MRLALDDGSLSDLRRDQNSRTLLGAVAVCALVLVVGVSIWSYTYELNLTVSWNGWTPVSYTYKSCHPEWFADDFPSGVENYDASLVMHVFVLAYKHMGILPETTLAFFIIAELLLVGLCVWVAVRVLRPDAPPAAAVAAIILVIASPARDMSLAAFGQPFFAGQCYNIVDFLRVCGIVLIVRLNVVSGFALLALAGMNHPVMGALGMVFGMVALLPRWREISVPRTVYAILGCCVVWAAWTVWVLPPGSVVASSIPAERWVELTRFSNVHWYPLPRGYLTVSHTAQVLPFLSLLILFVVALRHARPLRGMDRSIIAGCAAMAVMTVIGLCISVWVDVPTLIKLCLHRSNDLIVFFGLIYAVPYLWKEIVEGASWRGFVALALLITPFLMHPGFPLALVLLLVVISIGEALWRWEFGCSFLALVLVPGIVLALLYWYWRSGYVAQWSCDSYTGYDSWKYTFSRINWVGAIAAAGLLATVDLRLRRMSVAASCVALATVAALGSIRVVNSQAFLVPPEELKGVRDYREVQLWAREHTAPDALFMVDPKYKPYGWRDVSRRSSFGLMREWVHNGWAYSSSGEVLEEGLKRMGEFGIDIEPYLESRQRNQLSWRLRFAYHAFDDERLLQLADEYGIDYFVFQRQYVRAEHKLRLAYETEWFIVYAAEIPVEPPPVPELTGPVLCEGMSLTNWSLGWPGDQPPTATQPAGTLGATLSLDAHRRAFVWFSVGVDGGVAGELRVRLVGPENDSAESACYQLADGVMDSVMIDIGAQATELASNINVSGAGICNVDMHVLTLPVDSELAGRVSRLHAGDLSWVELSPRRAVVDGCETVGGWSVGNLEQLRIVPTEDDGVRMQMRAGSAPRFICPVMETGESVLRLHPNSCYVAVVDYELYSDALVVWDPCFYRDAGMKECTIEKRLYLKGTVPAMMMIQTCDEPLYFVPFFKLYEGSDLHIRRLFVIGSVPKAHLVATPEPETP